MPRVGLEELIELGEAKTCSRCRSILPIAMFRLLVHGYRQGMCTDCERDWDRQRWRDRRSPAARLT